MSAAPEFEFESFDQNDAWLLGSAAVDIILERGIALAVEIRIGTHAVFKAALNGVDVDTDAWLAGKAAIAKHFGESSLEIRYRHDSDPSVTSGLDPSDYRPHGGSVPIHVRGAGVVGTITVSGAADTVDHEIAVQALHRAAAAKLEG